MKRKDVILKGIGSYFLLRYAALSISKKKKCIKLFRKIPENSMEVLKYIKFHDLLRESICIDILVSILLPSRVTL